MRLATFDVDTNTETMFADQQHLKMEMECVMHELVDLRLPSTTASPIPS